MTLSASSAVTQSTGTGPSRDDGGGGLDQRVRRHRLADKAICRDLRARPYRDRPDEGAADPDVHVALNHRSPRLQALCIGARSKRHVLEQYRSSPNARGAADRDPHSVHDDDARVDLGLPVNVRSVDVADHPGEDLGGQRHPGIGAKAHDPACREHLEADTGDEIVCNARLVPSSVGRILAVVMYEHRVVFAHGGLERSQRTRKPSRDADLRIHFFSPSRAVRTHSSERERSKAYASA